MAKPFTGMVRASPDALLTVAWPTASSLIIGGVHGALEAWQLAEEKGGESLKVVRSLSGAHLLGVQQVSAAGDHVATIGINGEVAVRTLSGGLAATARLAADTPLAAFRVSINAVAPTQLATGSLRGAVQLLRVSDDGAALSRVASVPSRGGAFALCVAFSPDGARVAAGHADGTLSLVDAATGTLAATVDAHQLAVRSVAWSPDGSVLYTASDDGRVGVFDVSAAAAHVCSLAGHMGFVSALAPSPDRPGVLVSCGADKTVKLWDAGKRECVRTFEGSNNACVSDVVFAPDGKRVATVSDTGGLQLHAVA
jgi:WD repeat-containing protein 61